MHLKMMLNSYHHAFDFQDLGYRNMSPHLTCDLFLGTGWFSHAYFPDLYLFLALGIKLRALHIMSIHTMDELCPSPSILF